MVTIHIFFCIDVVSGTSSALPSTDTESSRRHKGTEIVAEAGSFGIYSFQHWLLCCLERLSAWGENFHIFPRPILAL